MKKFAVITYGKVKDVLFAKILENKLYNTKKEATDALKKEVIRQYEEFEKTELYEYRKKYALSDEDIRENFMMLEYNIWNKNSCGYVNNVMKADKIKYYIQEIEL